MQNSSKFTSCSGQICIKTAFLTFVIAHDKANTIALDLNLRYEPKKSPKVIVIDIHFLAQIDRVVKPAVQSLADPGSASRDTFQCMTFIFIFIPVLSRPPFTSKTPDKDQKI